MISVTDIVTSSAPLGVDMTYLVTRAISGPHDVDKAVHAFSMFGGPLFLPITNPDKSACALKTE